MKSFQIRSFFWSLFYRIGTEYRDWLGKSPHYLRIRENTDLEKRRIWTLSTQRYCLHYMYFFVVDFFYILKLLQLTGALLCLECNIQIMVYNTNNFVLFSGNQSRYFFITAISFSYCMVLSTMYTEFFIFCRLISRTFRSIKYWQNLRSERCIDYIVRGERAISSFPLIYKISTVYYYIIYQGKQNIA